MKAWLPCDDVSRSARKLSGDLCHNQVLAAPHLHRAGCHLRNGKKDLWKGRSRSRYAPASSFLYDIPPLKRQHKNPAPERSEMQRATLLHPKHGGLQPEVVSFLEGLAKSSASRTCVKVRAISSLSMKVSFSMWESQLAACRPVASFLIPKVFSPAFWGS